MKLRGVATDFVINPDYPETQYACIMRPGETTGRGVYRTTDGWDTSTLLTDSVLPTGGSFDRASIAICHDYPNVIAIVVENDGDPMGIYKSLNHGSSWTDITGTALDSIHGGQLWHAQAIAIRPDNANYIYVGGAGFAYTSNGGSSWTTTWNDSFIGHADITQLYFHEATGDNSYWICNDGGVFLHEIGGNLTSWNGDLFTGLRTSQIDFMDAQRGFRTIGLQDNGIVYKPEGLADWVFLTGGDGFGVRITDALTPEWWYIDGIWSRHPHTGSIARSEAHRRPSTRTTSTAATMTCSSTARAATSSPPR